MSSVTVEINGRETVSQAALAAKNGLSGLGAEAKNTQGATSGLSSETSKLNGMFGGFVITAGDVVNAVKDIAQAAYSTIRAFAEQEKSIAQFTSAMDLSGRITSEEAEGLRILADEIANLTGEDDEAILSMEAFLAASGRNESQIRKLISAAADYSAATGKDMRTAVEELNKTFSGTEGRLGMLIPGLKDLTEEELKAGKGIDVVAKQYDGFAAKMSGIADVDLKNFKNAYDDVLAALGKEVWPAIQPALQGVTDYMRDELIPGIGNVARIIVAVFQNFQEVAKLSFQFILDIIQRALSWDSLKDIFTGFGSYFIDTIGNALSTIPNMFTDIVGLMFNPVYQLGKYIFDTLSKAIRLDFKDIKSPGDYLVNLFTSEFDLAKGVIGSSFDLFQKQQNSVSWVYDNISGIFDGMGIDFAAKIEAVIGPTLAALIPEAASGGGIPGSDPVGASADFVAKVEAAIKEGNVNKLYDYLNDSELDKSPELLAKIASWFAKANIMTPADLVGGLMSAGFLDKTSVQPWDFNVSDRDPNYGKYIRLGLDLARTGARGQSGIAPTDKNGNPYIPRSDFALQATQISEDARVYAETLVDILGSPSEQGDEFAQAYRDKMGDWKLQQLTSGLTGSMGQSGVNPVDANGNPYVGRTDFASQLGMPTDLRGGAAAFINNGAGAVTGQDIGFFDSLSGGFASIFSGITSGVMPLLQSLEMFEAVIDPATTILSGVMDVLGPLINTILEPLVGVLRIVGQTIGSIIAPLLSILGPIITALANTFVWLYNNVFRHIGNGLIFIFNGMYNAFAGFVNGLSGLIKIITFGAVNLGRVATRDDREGFLERIDLGTVTSAGGASATSGASGSSATYERPRDITINVSVETSALVGSGGITEFAMILRREFVSLGVLNMGTT